MSTGSTAGSAVNGVSLRPYQSAAVERVRLQLRNTRRVLLVAPTGAGKTVIASHMIERAHAKGRRVVFFAHRRELIRQTRSKLIAAGVEPMAIGIMMADDPLTNPAAPIQVASIDTFRHRDPPVADLVIVDEAHRSLAPTYTNAIDHYAETGAAVLGMTATPYRADGGGLGGVYEAIEVVASPAELVAAGYLVAPRVFSAPFAARPDLSGVRVRGGDYVEGDLSDAMNTGKLVGGIVEHWQKHAGSRRTVAFAVGVAHSQAIAAAFVEAGIAAEHLDGTTPTKERDAILARLETGETKIVSNCGVLCEGWDQPSVKVAILARPTKSTGLYLQQAGRILRPWEGASALILDHAGNALEHGLPQDDREFTLDAASKHSTGEAPTKECPECCAVLPMAATQCPECGFGFPRRETDPTEVADGELVELKTVLEQELRAGWDDLLEQWNRINERRSVRGEQPIKPGWIWFKFRERYQRKPPKGCRLPAEIASDEVKSDALRELHSVARARGYKAGWAVHRYRERFGHDPGATA